MAKIELLAPAGDLERAKTAILYGADAVYIGGRQFSLRSRASNFDLEQIAQLADFAHEHGSKVHVTVNMLPHEEDLEGLEDYLQALDQARVDAIIAASPAIIKLAQSLNPGYEIHVSTQHSSTNSLAVQFWKAQQVQRVVLARECTLENILDIADQNILPIEVFIHGGMCISCSGRCVLSNHMTLRDANRGGCAQSCRWKYHLLDQDQPMEDPSRPFSMSSKDLQGVDFIEDLIHHGVASLKIEGRMKSAYYLATVVSSYRRLIDEIYEKGTASEEFKEEIRREIAKAENRATAQGFFKGDPDASCQLYQERDEIVKQEFAAVMLDYRQEDGMALLQVKNRFYPHSDMEIFGPHIPPTPARIEEICDEDGQVLEVCNKPMQKVWAKWQGPYEKLAMVRVNKE